MLTATIRGSSPSIINKPGVLRWIISRFDRRRQVIVPPESGKKIDISSFLDASIYAEAPRTFKR
jgi:hypothetical protein